jgi:alkanesulfonate monooxygenase SsuD/methylene tetrahydromethanopterin reductase-like flavin-dependent oxidoreductase (luciferase family)
MERCGVPMSETQERFNESLDILQALLRDEEVAWDGKHYQYDPVTVMPRPLTPGGPQMMMAVLNPEGIYHCTKRGFHIQTTPLAGQDQLLRDQVSAFNRAKEEMGGSGRDLSLTLSRVGYVTNSAAEREAVLDQAEDYFARFDNVFTGPGIVENGMIARLPRKQSREELAGSLLIGSPDQIISQLSRYAEMGIDRFIVNFNFGMESARTRETMQQFAREVAPHFCPDMAARAAS